MSQALARSIASSSVRNRVIAAIGPKFSSAMTFMSSVTSVSTVGSKKWPALKAEALPPPATTLAPARTASATIPSISARRDALPARERRIERRPVRFPSGRRVMAVSGGRHRGAHGLLVVVFSVQTGGVWLSKANLTSVLQVTATLGIMALGESLVIAAREIDISVGAVFGIGSLVYLGFAPSPARSPR